MAIYKSEVAGDIPVTSIYLYQEKHGLYVAVPSILPPFMLPFYCRVPSAFPWLYASTPEKEYLGKLPLSFFVYPVSFKLNRIALQEEPLKVVKYYLIPEPDKNLFYTAIKIYKSMHIPITFKVTKNKRGRYFLEIIHDKDFKAFISNAYRDKVNRLKTFIHGYNYTTLYVPINNGINLGNDRAVGKVDRIFWRE